MYFFSRTMETQLTSICFVAGHSGGHMLPTITKAQQHKNKYSLSSILFFTTSTSLDQRVLKDYTFIDTVVPLHIENLPSIKTLWRLPLFGLKLFVSFFKSIYYLSIHKPSVIISMGGYVSIPVCLAGKVLGIPVELYELNVEPGKAISFLAPFARSISITYQKTATYFPRYTCTYVPYPVRFTEHDKALGKDYAREKLGLSTTKKTIFVLGGSKGSQALNKFMFSWIHNNTDLHSDIQLIHQLGEHHLTHGTELYKSYNIPHIIFDYRNDLALLYQSADLIICRAGAGTLAEVSFFNKSALIIPLETKQTQHQLYNAQEMVHLSKGAMKLIRQHEVEKNIDKFDKEIINLLKT